MGSLYLDASAAVKLIVEEPESAALATYLTDHARRWGAQPSIVSSDLLRTEVLAVAGRAGASVDEARTLLRSVHLISLTAAVCDAAGRLAGEVVGPALGSLDAIHHPQRAHGRKDWIQALTLGGTIGRLLHHQVLPQRQYKIQQALPAPPQKKTNAPHSRF